MKASSSGGRGLGLRQNYRRSGGRMLPTDPLFVGKVRSARVPNELELPIETSLVMGVSSRQVRVKLPRGAATAGLHGRGIMVRSSVSRRDDDKL